MKVSIVMPTYNMQNTIDRAIDSIIKQTYKDWELIIVNDGSIDYTDDLVKEYIEKDNRIRLCSLYQNQGRANAYNIGIVQAKADLIAIHNADDVYYPKKIEKQIVIFTWNKILDVLGTGLKIPKYNKKEIAPHQVTAEIYKHMMINHATIMFKKKWFYKVGGYDTKFKRCVDWDFCCKLFDAGAVMQSINTILYVWYPNINTDGYNESVDAVRKKWEYKTKK